MVGVNVTGGLRSIADFGAPSALAHPARQIGLPR